MYFLTWNVFEIKYKKVTGMQKSKRKKCTLNETLNYILDIITNHSKSSIFLSCLKVVYIHHCVLRWCRLILMTNTEDIEMRDQI